MPYVLGVDLGTTFTAAAVDRDGVPTMVGLGNRALQVPSVLYRAEEGFLVGEPAERRGAADPSRVAREFKRRLGDRVPVLVGGEPFPAEALTATLLGWVVERTSRQLGEPPGALVLTHPAGWTTYKLEVLDRVLALAGVEARLCPEPVAAAAQYAARARVATGDRLAVYDFGGGTFDVCLLEKTAAGFAVLGEPAGVEHLGGADLDEALFRHVLARLELPPVDPELEDPALVAGLARLRRECVDAKEALSSDVDAVLAVTLPGLATTTRVTRREFETLIRPAVVETLEATRRSLRSADLAPTDLAGIVLVGGGSRIPLVAELLQGEFGVPTVVDTHPKHDVALGAVRVGTAARTPAPVPVPATPRPAPAPAPATPVPARTGGPRRPVLLGAAAAAVVGAVVLALVLQQDRPGAAEPGPVTAGPASTGTPAGTPAAPSLPALPRSRPLTASELVVPLQRGGSWDLYLADTKVDEPPSEPLTTSRQDEAFPVLSPDRRTVVYVRDPGAGGTRSLRVAGAADGQGDRALFRRVPAECGGRVRRPAWSRADPTLLALACTDAGGAARLLLVRTDGSVVRELTTGQDRVEDPTFSPDGTQLAYWAGPAGGPDGGDLFAVPTSRAGSPRPLTSGGQASGRDNDPAWSPDGSTLAFRRRVPDGTPDGDLQVFVMPAAGGEATSLTAGQPYAQDPSWAASGQALAYKSADRVRGLRRGVSRIWLMNADGTDKNVLWPDGDPEVQSAPAWSTR